MFIADIHVTLLEMSTKEITDGLEPKRTWEYSRTSLRGKGPINLRSSFWLLGLPSLEYEVSITGLISITGSKKRGIIYRGYGTTEGGDGLAKVSHWGKNTDCYTQPLIPIICSAFLSSVMLLLTSIRIPSRHPFPTMKDSSPRNSEAK